MGIANGVAVDKTTGEIIVVGEIGDSSLGSQAIVMKLSSDGNSVIYKHTMGGAQYDSANGVAIDNNGSTYVVGTSFSTNFRVGCESHSTSADAYVTKFDYFGEEEYTTCVGGTGDDQGFNVAISPTDGHIYIVGQTNSASGNFPITGSTVQTSFGGSFDGFIAKVNQESGELQLSTYLGGSGNDCEIGGVLRECDIAVDKTGVYVTGPTSSPTSQLTIQSVPQTGVDKMCWL